MATKLTIDRELVQRALELSGEKSKEAAVARALREFIARREPRRRLELFESVDWDPEYESKRERSRR